MNDSVLECAECQNRERAGVLARAARVGGGRDRIKNNRDPHLIPTLPLRILTLTE